ncbi:hypothetical protein I79_022028 [Cricetulus griseus]|uniref:Uncharacterized protein n=1 Tax=Cricetulus griseus TaxID=10029 RepID=G3IE84_CRIGR|nr:hypothetical protein I79_022028 [Cricetulus griseus]
MQDFFTRNEITLYLLMLYVNFMSEKEYLYLNIFLLVKLIVYYNIVNFALLKNEVEPIYGNKVLLKLFNY